ncbi:MAG: hypothetical protein KJP08_05430 [Gammaproteobacteria bacterium]|nr:hypothetical protein [Gammaproteobacteria bacterium]NNF50212.1 hypothetical protein [Woeseiaceae bacterium]MBT8094234.1 hypothetical protein [Gammaproteobacteria bacterium]MBT8104431.1 hypothetical protein [Gammaproteobacteria bacterium]NNK24447.1 hypothetical protein [Woeseiaceae bacterium]
MDNRTLIRDVAVFQFKLVVDGLRDLFLVPISLVAGILSLVTGREGAPGQQFYQVLVAGKQSELWIDLFGALRNAPEDVEQPVPFPDAKMDEMLDGIEAFVVDEERRGGMTAQARARFEKALHSFQDRRDAHASGGTDGDEPPA